MTRIAHFIASTHWDREWYEHFQGFRMRLVSLLDEVLQTLDADPGYASFMTDSQSIMLLDYLAIRPERTSKVQELLRAGRLVTGPWYVLPDEWLVSGESIIRNIELGRQVARELGGEPMSAGMVVDQFGHISQLPQIFSQFGFPMAFVWRGTSERDCKGHFLWRAPDGSTLPTYRFGVSGYPTVEFHFRGARYNDITHSIEKQAAMLVEATLLEAQRSPLNPILLYTGGDHMEIEPQTSRLLSIANQSIASHQIQIVHSTVDRYVRDVLKEQHKITRTAAGELRVSGADPIEQDEQWLIPGVLSSRIHLKQRNAECEDELTTWTEPLCTLATAATGAEYPASYLRTAWTHLLENHPHDSMCGCSVDAVHRDMLYRFDQSFAISSRLSEDAMRAIAIASAPADLPKGAIALSVFNPLPHAIDEPFDLEIALPPEWPTTFSEFFGYEQKFAFVLRDPQGRDVPYQLTAQTRNRAGKYRKRYRFPTPDPRNVVAITARLALPAMGYVTLVVEPHAGPTRYLGSLMADHQTLDNGILRVTANANGTIDIHDYRTQETYRQLLTFEERADIGDGWNHGPAVNDQVYHSTAGKAQVSVVHDGPEKATIEISLDMPVPRDFDFAAMRRSADLVLLKLRTQITLRGGANRVECQSTIENVVRDHRVRVLLPTHTTAEKYLSDSAFDVIERPIKLPAGNAASRELNVETRPQHTWTGVCDGKRGLAIVSRGLPETAVRDQEDRAIALTLLRGTRRELFTDPGDGGQILGEHTFRFFIVPCVREIASLALSQLGQQVLGSPRSITVLPRELPDIPSPAMPRSGSFFSISGNSLLSSLRVMHGKIEVRLFNTGSASESVELRFNAAVCRCQPIKLCGEADTAISPQLRDGVVVLEMPAKRIATLLCELSS